MPPNYHLQYTPSRSALGGPTRTSLPTPVGALPPSGPTAPPTALPPPSVAPGLAPAPAPGFAPAPGLAPAPAPGFAPAPGLAPAPGSAAAPGPTTVPSSAPPPERIRGRPLALLPRNRPANFPPSLDGRVRVLNDQGKEELRRPFRGILDSRIIDGRNLEYLIDWGPDSSWEHATTLKGCDGWIRHFHDSLPDGVKRPGPPYWYRKKAATELMGTYNSDLEAAAQQGPPGQAPQQTTAQQPAVQPQPEVQQPGLEQSGVQQPAVQQQPAVGQPVVQQQPEVQQSGLEQSEFEQPGFEQAEFEQPGFEQAEFEQPGFEQPGFEQPEVQQPEVQQPGLEQSGVQEPAVQQQPEVQQPEVQQPAVQETPAEQAEAPAPPAPPAPAFPNFKDIVLLAQESEEIFDDPVERLLGQEQISPYARLLGVAHLLVEEFEQQLPLDNIRWQLHEDMAVARLPAAQSVRYGNCYNFLESRYNAKLQTPSEANFVALPPNVDRDTASRLNPGNGMILNTTAVPVHREASPGPWRHVHSTAPPADATPADEVVESLAGFFVADHPAHPVAERIVRPPPATPETDPLVLATIPYVRTYEDGKVQGRNMKCLELKEDGTVCGKPTSGACEDLRHTEPNVAVCDDCDAASRRRFLNEVAGVAAGLRAYTCATCATYYSEEPQRFVGTGNRIFGGYPVDQPEEPRLALNYSSWMTIGGWQGVDPLPLTGCACATKLLERRLCSPHRLHHLIQLRLEVEKIDQYLMQSYGTTYSCPKCHTRPSVDAFNHRQHLGNEGGKRVWFCKACHDAVIAPADGTLKRFAWEPVDQSPRPQ
ncbi:hypothetical protein F5Y05DRAFT_369224 [Hypoxylon sp. FL0543]|nr:hypothetical protein F5Y05DRAFT_369224 [Hypoxylon sp. FL0543]